MNNIVKTIAFIISFCFSNQLLGQVSNVKLDNDVYKFLSVLSQKGVFDEYDDLVKPLSRRYIAKKLIEVKENLTNLTRLQKDELIFYSKEYGYEIEKVKNEKLKVKSFDKLQDQATNSKKENANDKRKKKKRSLLDQSWQVETYYSDYEKRNSNRKFVLTKKDDYKRWRFFSFQNEDIYLNINPIFGYEIANWKKKNYQNLSLGLNFNGEVGNSIGFNFELKQIRQSPTVKSYLYNKFTKNTAIKEQLIDSERREYATVNVDLGVNWEWGSFTIGKNHLNLGYAENGKIILSEKAPSFPYIKLSLKPAEWFSFNYIHAWLNSEVIDSNAYYSSWRIREYENTDRAIFIQKFIAMHSLTITPIKGLDFTIGESIVYADDLQPIFFIPIMVFDLADEYLNNSNNYAGASTQLFLALSSRNHIKNTHLYASFHADELTPEGLFDPAIQYYKFAFTFGGSVVDFPIENLGLTLEYTKVYPGNYRHFIPTLTYESSSALLGHWMGDNGDLFYGAIDYTIFRGLKIKLWTQHIRKGTEALGNRAYKIQIPQPGFLFTDNIGDRKNYAYYGIEANYEILHDFWVMTHYQYIDYEQRTSKDKYRSTLYRDFSLSLGYGL